jgi:hypothetical protein
MNGKSSKLLVSSLLIVIAVGLLIPIYNVPTWWVSLEAPNYPEEAFPDGVRIMFFFNGIFNGCELMDKAEIQSDEALDCVHEMDTINHYVGMYPIASGAPIELFFSIFLVALVAVMLLAYVAPNTMIRTIVMVAGFGALAVWMGLTWYGDEGIKYHDGDYLLGRVTVLGETGEEEDVEESLSAADALIARLKASLEESGEIEAVEPEPESEVELSAKEQSIAHLKGSFEAYQERRPGGAQEWTGSGSQLLGWHYEISLGRYFRDADTLAPMVKKMVNAGNILFWAIIGVMVALIVLARKPGGLFDKLLLLLPISLPALFLIEYSAWLWWYGHNMNEMGAFSLKPFMPTVFGQGKVAQFTTNSYPALGFWLVVLFAALLIIAATLRMKREQDETED